MISHISINDNGKTILLKINANKIYIENLCYGTNELSIITKEDITSYAIFASLLNSMFGSLAVMVCDDDLYTTINGTAYDNFVSRVNSNFDDLSIAADAFMNNGLDYYIIIKTLTISGKGMAKILAQNDNWKFAFYGSEDILYLSDDCGLTWKYNKTFIDCNNIRMAFVFKSGAVLFALQNNKVYSSQDYLSTINEITVKEMNGDDFIFHTPINPTYPGVYFDTYGIKSFVVDGKEILLFGCYDPYNQSTEKLGAVPINEYYSADDGRSLKVCYKWGGYSPYAYDNGTQTGGAEGVNLGDPNNPITIHVHTTSFNSVDKSFWVQTGEAYPYTHWDKFIYDSINDSWTITSNTMPNSGNGSVFRSTGMSFLPDGNSLFWGGDSNGTIYKVDYDKITNIIQNHTAVYIGNVDILGISPYSEVMFATGFYNVNFLLVSVDYGETWNIISNSYKSKMGGFYTYKIMGGADNNGYYLIQAPPSGQAAFNATNTFLLKVIKR